MTKFLAVCSTGLGSSFMVHMNIDKVLKDLEIDGVTVDHADLGSVANGDADAVFVGRHVLPWVGRRLRRTSSGARRTGKHADWVELSAS